MTDFAAYCEANARFSSAQLKQDLFVLHHLNDKRDGFFVEFGACDGVLLSNTALLEYAYGWNGILAEPAKCWHERLRENRSCAIDTRCVWNRSGADVAFRQAKAAEYSTMEAFHDLDHHGPRRADGEVYWVETVSLMDLLIAHKAPPVIDYLSLDTEGTEVEILGAFDFDRFEVRVITVEHNYTANRERLFDILTAKGFTRAHQEASAWDDWYVR